MIINDPGVMFQVEQLSVQKTVESQTRSSRDVCT
jgi:hypothetical protein